MNEEISRLEATLGDKIISYKDVDIYYTFKDNDDVNNSPSEYWFTCDLGDCDAEFDIRQLDCYNPKLDEKEILRRAIDLGLID